MTNLKGVRMYCAPTDAVQDYAIAYKDISTLAIIAPFSITARVRIYVTVSNPSTSDYYNLSIGAKYGGVSNQLYHRAGLLNLLGATTQRRGVSVNDTTTYNWNTTQDKYDDYTWLSETWFWMQLNVNVDRELTVKIKEDTGTTKPSTWDYTTTNIVNIIDATPEQILQEVLVGVTFKTAAATSGNRAIFEVDEIYVEQD